MISAVEALRLASAKLSDEERQAADRLESEIEERVRTKMTRNGIHIEGRVSSSNVLAEVNQRLKNAGWAPQWQQVFEQHALNKAIRVLVGYTLQLAPTDESYRAAAQP